MKHLKNVPARFTKHQVETFFAEIFVRIAEGFILKFCAKCERAFRSQDRCVIFANRSFLRLSFLHFSMSFRSRRDRSIRRKIFASCFFRSRGNGFAEARPRVAVTQKSARERRFFRRSRTFLRLSFPRSQMMNERRTFLISFHQNSTCFESKPHFSAKIRPSRSSRRSSAFRAMRSACSFV